MTKLLTLGILFLTTVRAPVVAKLVILGILPLTSIILALREALVAKLVILGIKKKQLYGPFLWMGFNCLKARATSKWQFTFYH